eukprot:6183399-Pleurochrysis_carterae.AAC.2
MEIPASTPAATCCCKRYAASASRDVPMTERVMAHRLASPTATGRTSGSAASGAGGGFMSGVSMKEVQSMYSQDGSLPPRNHGGGKAVVKRHNSRSLVILKGRCQDAEELVAPTLGPVAQRDRSVQKVAERQTCTL